MRDEKPPRIVVLHEETTALLRPDLVVEAVKAPLQTLSTEPVDVVADLVELNGDVGAKATVELWLGPTPVAEAKTVTVAKGGSLSVAFDGVSLTSAMTAELTVVVGGRRAVRDRRHEQLPRSDDRGDRARARPFEGPRAEPRRLRRAVQPTRLRSGHTDAAGELARPRSEGEALEPQLVRIFFHEVQERNADQLASFYETVELAQQSGATINITYHTAANARFNPGPFMRDFAIVLENLVTTKGLTNVRWVTIQNEPNTTNVTQEQYEALYRALDGELVTRGLRDHIGLMGGDLVESSAIPGSNHLNWFEYMAENMNDVLDAYSVHIYWNYWDTPANGVPAKERPRDRHQEAARRGAKAGVHHGVRRSGHPEHPRAARDPARLLG